MPLYGALPANAHCREKAPRRRAESGPFRILQTGRRQRGDDGCVCRSLLVGPWLSPTPLQQLPLIWSGSSGWRIVLQLTVSNPRHTFALRGRKPRHFTGSVMHRMRCLMSQMMRLRTHSRWTRVGGGIVRAWRESRDSVDDSLRGLGFLVGLT